MEQDDMPDFFKENAEKTPSNESENFEKAKERLNFDIATDENDVLEDTTVPYDFREDHKSADDEDNAVSDENRFLSVRIHAIGIGILIGVLLAILFGVFLFGSDENANVDVEPIVIEGSTRPAKVRPTNPGGMEIPDQDKTVYKRMRSDQVDTQVEVVSITQEKPVQPQIKTKEGGILGTPQPVMTNEEMEWEVLNLKDKVIQIDESAKETELTEAEPEIKEEVKTAIVQPEVVKSEPVVQKTTQQQPKQNVATATTTQKTASTSTKTKTTKTMQKTGYWHVQLISMTSKTAVNKEWPKILKAHSALLSGLPQDIKEVSVKGKTFYRLIVGEFKNKKDAQNLCSKLKARKQDCAITK